MIKNYLTKLFIVVFFIILGIGSHALGLLDADKMLKIARELTDHWWLVVLLILSQIVLFTFALAGSFFLWIVAPLYPPEIATFILTTGGTLGGVTAYLFSKHLSNDWRAKIADSRTYKALQKQDNFLTLFALRVFPAFPHFLINYSSGILCVQLRHFIAAAILGIAIKSYAYSTVIHTATVSASLTDLLEPAIYGPLIFLSAMSLIGIFIRHKLLNTSKKQL
ncbi:MAG: VTT domain-containing protein [Pseudomonadota bacterium]|nr:VTT domain-containing protein [Pseudomonadota bacterium]